MKLLNSISFYILLVMAIVMILNNEFNYYDFIGLVILGILIMSLKNSSKENIYELLGIDWLKKKFKNFELIMDMTKE